MVKYIVIYLVCWFICSVICAVGTIREYEREGKKLNREFSHETFKDSGILLLIWWIAIPFVAISIIALVTQRKKIER